ncbi:MAG: hypothetical protein J0L70_24935 [Leptolyngbya sp. UWPOB_LEPTO1]|nr:hypothetical protein [Leptolyngbya sp. UWPOB_LEPTO1]
MSGLILPRKSIEPIAERGVGSNAQSLQQFVNQSLWAPEQLEKAGVPKDYHTFQEKWRSRPSRAIPSQRNAALDCPKSTCVPSLSTSCKDCLS